MARGGTQNGKALLVFRFLDLTPDESDGEELFG